MEIYQLAYFIALARQGSASKAAQQLYVSRQALSKGVHKLEQEIGTPLFTSTNNQIVITDLGRQLYADAEPIVDAFSRLSEHYVNYGVQRDDNTVKIAAVTGALITLHDHTITDFFAEYPGINMSLENVSTDAALEAVRSGDAVLGLVGSSSRYLTDFTAVCLVRTGSWLNVPKDSPLASKETIHIEDLEGQHMVTFGEHDHLHRRLIEACRQYDVHPDITEISDTELVISIAKLKHALFFDFPQDIYENETRKQDDERVIRYLDLCENEEEVIGTYIIRRRNTQLPATASALWKWFVNAWSTQENAEGTHE